jgi:hypothetical protein
MRLLWLIGLIAASSVPVAAQQSLPDLKGHWSGELRSLVYGANAYHPGPQTPADPPRIREFQVFVDVEGQDGNLLWGKTWIGDGPKDPFAWAIGPDGRTIVGSDSDGSHFLTLLSPDRMERCYTHDGTSTSQSIVATCGVIERVRP